MKKKIIYAIAGIVIVIGGIYGWNYYKFLTTHIETDDAQVDGNIVPVLSRVGSFITNVHVIDNELVKKGQLLVELDSMELLSRVAQSKANYESASTSIAVAQRATEDAKFAEQLALANLEEPKTNLWKAQKEYERYDDLFKQKLATPQQFDNVKADVEKAQAQLDVAQQKYKSAQGQYKTSLAQLKVAESTVSVRGKDLDYAKLQLSYTKVYAPVDGRVSKKTIQPGQLIQAGQPLMALVQDKNIWVTANFKETQLEGMEIGSPVDIMVDAFPHNKFTGKVESLGGATGAKFSLLPPDNASGNFVKVVQRLSVRIAFDQTPEVEQLLKPGLSVKVEVAKK